MATPKTWYCLHFGAVWFQLTEVRRTETTAILTRAGTEYRVVLRSGRLQGSRSGPKQYVEATPALDAEFAAINAQSQACRYLNRLLQVLRGRQLTPRQCRQTTRFAHKLLTGEILREGA